MSKQDNSAEKVDLCFSGFRTASSTSALRYSSRTGVLEQHLCSDRLLLQH